MIRGFAALVVCILLAVPAVAEGKFWTDSQTGNTWTTDPQVCGPRAQFEGESWVAIQTWTNPQTGNVWTTDPRATGSPFVGWGCSWVEILVWVNPQTGATWTTDPNPVGPTWTGFGHTWTNIDPSTVSVSGQLTFDLVPVVGGNGMGFPRLDYNGVQARPVRGVTVQLIDANDNVTVVDTGVSDAIGDYSLSGPGNADVFLRIRAEMVQGGTPNWDVRVVDDMSNDALYVLDGPPFNMGFTNTIRNFNAPSGWTGTSYGNPRSAAPFAILDAIYDAIQFILTADSAASFPPLVVNWNQNNATDASFSTRDGIFLRGREDDDTDEYDRGVIVHEWVHYFQDSFSRDDSIGGSHAQGDQLDMRVAFSEGLAYAVAGMILGDSVIRDTFGIRQEIGFTINVEGETGPNPGWYSEESVQEIVYDLLDSDVDSAEDTLSLGFGPVYSVLTNQVRTSIALTSIFSFIDGLKINRPADAALIDALVGTQSISVVADEYGSTETNSGNPPNGDTLPIYESITVNGAPVNVCSTDDFSSFSTDWNNKLGSNRYLRFNTASDGTHTVTATTTSAPANESTDPDMFLYQRNPIFDSQGPPDALCTPANLGACSESFSTALTPGDYVLEVYEWTNTNPSDDPDFPPIGRACFDVEITQP